MTTTVPSSILHCAWCTTCVRWNCEILVEGERLDLAWEIALKRPADAPDPLAVWKEHRRVVLEKSREKHRGLLRPTEVATGIRAPFWIATGEVRRNVGIREGMFVNDDLEISLIPVDPTKSALIPDGIFMVKDRGLGFALEYTQFDREYFDRQALNGGGPERILAEVLTYIPAVYAEEFAKTGRPESRP